MVVDDPAKFPTEKCLWRPGAWSLDWHRRTKNQKGAPMIPSRSVGGLALLVVAMALAGCGATRSSPDNPLSAGGLTPSLHGKEARLVAVAPGFAVKGYATLTVARFPVTDKLDDEGDRKFAAKMAAFYRTELVRRLRESGLRSEEHTSELQSPCNIVCRLLLEKKKRSYTRSAA